MPTSHSNRVSPAIVVILSFLAGIVMFYSAVGLLLTHAAESGEIVGSKVIAKTNEGHVVVLQTGTQVHLEAEYVLADGHKVRKISVQSGPSQGLTVIVAEEFFPSVILHGRAASL